jgi:hypothetical protein
MGTSKQVIKVKGQDLAFTCPQCEHGEDVLTEKNRRCLRCIEGTKPSFALLKAYRELKVREARESGSAEYEEIMK